MNPGDMVTPLWGSVRMLDDCAPYADAVATFDYDSLGIVIDTNYSPTDTLWVRVLASTGSGWLRRTQIDVLQ